MDEIPKFPIGTIVELIPEKMAALVLSKVEITYTEGGGSSTASTRTEEEEKLFPARILVPGTKRFQVFYDFQVGEKVVLMGIKSEKHTDGQIYSGNSEWQDYIDEYGSYFLQRECAILGSFYEEPYDLPAEYDEVVMWDFGIGKITVNLEDKTLDVDFDGEISINGKEIFLNS